MHGNAGDTPACGNVDHCQQVVFVAMHATGREQAEQVQTTRVGLDRVARGDQRGILCQRAVGNRRVDPGQILVNDAARTDVHVTDLGIPHLPNRQANAQAVRIDQAVWALGKQAPPVRALGQGNRVVCGFLTISPAIEDQQEHGFWSEHGQARRGRKGMQSNRPQMVTDARRDALIFADWQTGPRRSSCLSAG